MRTAWIIPVALAMLLAAGCASGRPEWTRAAGRPFEEAELLRDVYECKRENAYHYQGVGALVGPLSEQIKVDKDLYRACMRARGWVYEDD